MQQPPASSVLAVVVAVGIARAPGPRILHAVMLCVAERIRRSDQSRCCKKSFASAGDETFATRHGREIRLPAVNRALAPIRIHAFSVVAVVTLLLPDKFLSFPLLLHPSHEFLHRIEQAHAPRLEYRPQGFPKHSQVPRASAFSPPELCCVPNTVGGSAGYESGNCSLSDEASSPGNCKIYVVDEDAGLSS
ncbi:hypothetical protein TrVFT333_000405 [Trichoderma virens FT-333]|nr:hypothetical protein TrVFT333_000405 [Trichoderma virens FT-333]